MTPSRQPAPPAESESRRSDPLLAPALIPPVITAAAVAGLLLLARFYDSLPFHAPPCGLRAATGFPCLGCGGTRTMIALAHGDFAGAMRLNPLIFFGVIAAAAWLIVALTRHFFFPARAETPRRRLPIWVIVSVLVILFAANWVWLWLYLPE